MTNRRGRQGMALLFTLAAGSVLVILAVSLFSLYSSDVHSQSQQHQTIQAYWLARAGVERYIDTRQFPNGDYNFAPQGRCSVTRRGSDIVFEGQVGKQRRRIVLRQGDPARRIEEP